MQICMSWGVPPRMWVESYAPDREGIGFVLSEVSHVVENPNPDPEYHRMYVGRGVWATMLELGLAGGWAPAGTVLKKEGPFPPRLNVTNDYEPIDYMVTLKLVTDEDAHAWAAALKIVADKIDAGEMEISDYERACSKDYIRPFIEFLEKGKFWFDLDVPVWD